jgi:hypothetical protein
MFPNGSCRQKAKPFVGRTRPKLLFHKNMNYETQLTISTKSFNQQRAGQLLSVINPSAPHTAGARWCQHITIHMRDVRRFMLMQLKIEYDFLLKQVRISERANDRLIA